MTMIVITCRLNAPMFPRHLLNAPFNDLCLTTSFYRQRNARKPPTHGPRLRHRSSLHTRSPTRLNR